MRLHLPGLIRDRMPSGNVRWLVRVKGQASRRITLPCGPGEDSFQEAYAAARAGQQPKPRVTRLQFARTGTVEWLVLSYVDHMERLAASGQMSPLTVKQRRYFVDPLINHVSTSPNSAGRRYAELPMAIPQAELARFLDTMAATPGNAKNMLKFLRAMFAWAQSRGHLQINPAAGLTVAYRNAGGATPWSVADLEAYRKCHPRGTMAHLTLSLFLFTACRIGDAIRLGRQHETRIEGAPWLKWQPAKRGSAFVEMPILPPLLAAIRAQTVIGPTYILSGHGVPFRSPEGLRNRFKDWCTDAGLGHLSSHGIRKAAGELLSLHGATQYEIMAIHGHNNVASSAVYTKGADRRRLAASGASKLAGLDW